MFEAMMILNLRVALAQAAASMQRAQAAEQAKRDAMAAGSIDGECVELRPVPLLEAPRP